VTKPGVNKPTNVVILYHEKDESIKENVVKHLALLSQKQVIDLWIKSEINAGGEHEKMIVEKIGSADLVLCLVSSDLMACEKIKLLELDPVLTRAADERCIIIPVMARHYHLGDHPLSKYKSLPQIDKPLNHKDWQGDDFPYKEIARAVEDFAFKFLRDKETLEKTNKDMLNPEFRGIEKRLSQPEYLLAMQDLNLPENLGKPVTYIFLTEELHHIERLRIELSEREYDFYIRNIEDVEAIKDRIKRIRELFQDSSISDRITFIKQCLDLEKDCEELKHVFINPENSTSNKLPYIRGRYIIPFCEVIEEFELKLQAIAHTSINYSQN